MQIKVSKTFARFIQNTAKEKNLGYRVSVDEFTLDAYNFYVGDVFRAEQYGDWDASKSLMKVIRVEYPDNYYAQPLFLSTYELNKEYKARSVKTVEELKAMIIELIEI